MAPGDEDLPARAGGGSVGDDEPGTGSGGGTGQGTGGDEPGHGVRASEAERETFVSLLGYHYGTGTLSAEEFSERMEQVAAARSLTELYALTADLPFPPPLSHLKSEASAPRRRRWFR